MYILTNHILVSTYLISNRQTAIEKFCVHTKLNPNVVLVRIFPSMRTETIAYFLQPPIEGVVLQCYGAGNVPNNRKDIMNHLKEANERGVIILSVTQCINGSVSGLYATGKALLDIGIIPGLIIIIYYLVCCNHSKPLHSVLSFEQCSVVFEKKLDHLLANNSLELCSIFLGQSRTLCKGCKYVFFRMCL